MSVSEAGNTAVAPIPRSVDRSRAVLAFHIVALVGALAVCVLASRHYAWKANLTPLITLIVLAVLSELTSTLLPSSSGRLHISGSFLGITLTAVLLGGPPAALVGALTIIISWFRSREAPDRFRHNLVTFIWFPLLSGLLFHWLVQRANVPSQLVGYRGDARYYLLVFATFLVALALNFVMITGYHCYVTRTPMLRRLLEFQPVMAAELSSAVLTVVAAFLANEMPDHLGLVLFAIVLVVFQYLVGELLLSQRRGEDLEVMATTDELTGLVNRKHFNDRVDEAITALGDSEGAFGVLLLDLDHFKDINDALGHEYGDDLLANLGPRLQERIGAGGIVARFGGDEFAILPAIRTDDMEKLAGIAESVIECIREPVVFNDITLQVETSIGVARYPADGQDAQTLLRRADIAMYKAKADRSGHQFYAHGQDTHSTSRLTLVGGFRRALEKDDEIIVYFHPIVDLATGQVHGAEALVRWQHPEQGLLQPAAFLGMVEQTGLIGEMTEVVLKRAIAECAAWHAAGRELIVSVNLSVRNLHDDRLSSVVGRLLAEHRLPPHALKLEITESMILNDPPRALKTIESLTELGVRFAVDDFGTGHSSLANLRMLPVHELKIDRSFVTPMLLDRSVEDDPSPDAVIVRSTVELGHALGLSVVAEGVEDARTLARLEEIGCDRAQGHYFTEPVAPIEFMRWVSRHEAAYMAA